MQRTNLSASSWIDFKIFKKPEELFSQKRFNLLWENRCAKETYVTMYGKKVLVPRDQASYGRSYSFSGQVLETEGSIEESIYKDYLPLINSLGYGEFNQMVANCYADGTKYIGAHRDDEGELEAGSEVVTLTLCEPNGVRTFRVRDYKTKKIVKDFQTEHGFCYVMGGDMQKEFTHEIVKIAGKKGENWGRRISLTYRKFK